MSQSAEDSLRAAIAGVWGEQCDLVYLELLRRAQARPERPCEDCGVPLAVAAYPYDAGDWDYECRNKECSAFFNSGFPLVPRATA